MQKEPRSFLLQNNKVTIFSTVQPASYFASNLNVLTDYTVVVVLGRKQDHLM